MENLRIGNLIEGEQHRDAIHVAVAPVVASERLSPGQHVGFVGETVGATKDTIGIVDPFLKGPVFKGERFWIFLYPNTITSLRHAWAHPKFDNKDTGVSDSEAWLRVFADQQAGITYDELLTAAKGFLETGDYMSQGGRWDGVSAGDDFWDHYETVTGTIAPREKRGGIFSCSC